MIRLNAVPHKSNTDKSGRVIFVNPDHITQVNAPYDGSNYPGARAAVTVRDADCEMVAESPDEVMMLKAGWYNQHKIADTANSHELCLYVWLENTFVKPEKVMAR
ncbi:hypothetical protein BAJUN_02120 [Bajunvirus bajun]|uniref:Uncharacterized protein n=1 Tax=Brevundimonas phage vB_BgoS-Bajun TaxID=2948594 RepID=A0A9E7SUW2_9CAUD|nr:hypothetical protein BAJUN_02120 [Brevundimonas phage vB_BgoS-Bajun]